MTRNAAADIRPRRARRRLLAEMAVIGLLVGSLPTAAHAATFVVVNTADAGAGSLRAALAAANGAAGADEIQFADSALGVIMLDSALPSVTDGVRIVGRGPQVVSISGAHAVAPLEIVAGVTATLEDLTITSGRSFRGGAIYNRGNLTLTRVVLADSLAYGPGLGGMGGAVFNVGTLLVADSSLTGNYAAGILANGTGGGIVNFGVLAVNNTTFTANTSRIGGGLSNFGQAAVTNSTFSGNSASNGGAAIYTGGGSLEISSATLANNNGFAGGIFHDGGVIGVRSSLLVDSTGDNCSGGVNPSGNNLATDDTCGMPVATAAQINLGPLADNGGPTATHALLPGSVAIDAAADCTDLQGNVLSKDQRGFFRPGITGSPGSAACDLGAYELGGGASIPTLSGTALLGLTAVLAALGTTLLGRRVNRRARSR